MTKLRRHTQLGMNAGTAANRLRTDLLFAFVKAAGHACHRCGGELTRDTFSVEHKEAWLDSRDPPGLFFDLSNIAYSHHSCNSGAKRIPHKVYHSAEDRRDADCRLAREGRARTYTREKRQAKYARTGT